MHTLTRFYMNGGVSIILLIYQKYNDMILWKMYSWHFGGLSGLQNNFILLCIHVCTSPYFLQHLVLSTYSVITVLVGVKWHHLVFCSEFLKAKEILNTYWGTYFRSVYILYTSIYSIYILKEGMKE